MELIYDGGLANTRISADEHQLRPATRHYAVEGGKQSIDLQGAPVQLLWNPKPIGPVVLAQWEFVYAAPSLPFSKAASKISLNTRRCLVALLGSLGQQLHDDSGERGRHIFHPLFEGNWMSRDMAVNPFHGIGSGERKTPSEHFVKRDAEGVEIAPGIDRTIHSSGLLGCHVGQCPGDKLQRFGSLALAWKPRGDKKAPQPALAGDGVYQNVGRLDVLVDDSALMQVTNRSRKVNGQAQRKR